MIFKGKDRPLVKDDEKVARYVFEPSMFIGPTIGPCAFELARELPSGKPEDYLSVSRMVIAGEITSDSFPYKPRVDGDKFCGYAHIGVDKIHAFNQLATFARALEWPTKSNPAHSGVVYTSESEFVVGECHTEGYILLTAYLAAASTLVRFDITPQAESSGY